jgi:hypothetical protein
VVALTPRQAVAAGLLIRLAGRPVSRGLVAEAVQRGEAPPGPPAVRSLLTRLDRAVVPLGLRVHLLSSDAVMLEVQDEPVD